VADPTSFVPKGVPYGTPFCVLGPPNWIHGTVIGSYPADHYLAPSMKTPFFHSSLRNLVLALVMLVAVVPVLAENAKSSSNAKTATRQTASSFSPVTRAVASGVKALTVRKYTSEERAQVKSHTGRDSSVAPPRIVSARVSSEVFTTRVELASDESLVEISIFNMLGKRVMDVYKGASSRGVHEHTQSISELPDGVYMCVMQGANFRKAEKFFFNR
jgi:hypothetical protein